MTPSQVHSPSLARSYHSNWSDDLSPPHIIPPSLLGHQPLLNLGCLGTRNSRTEVPLVVPEMPSADMPSKEPGPLQFGKGRGRGMWSPQVIVPQCLVMDDILFEDSLKWMALLVEDEVWEPKEQTTEVGLMAEEPVEVKDWVLTILGMVMVMVEASLW